MHEWALAEGVIATALEAGEREGLRTIRRVDVRIGALQRIDPEVFDHALKTVLPADEPRLEGVEFALTVEPVLFRCQACGREFGAAEAGGPAGADEAEAIHFLPELAHAFLECPGCASPDFRIVEGRGVSIAGLEGD